MYHPKFSIEDAILKDRKQSVTLFVYASKDQRKMSYPSVPPAIVSQNPVYSLKAMTVSASAAL